MPPLILVGDFVCYSGFAWVSLLIFKLTVTFLVSHGIGWRLRTGVRTSLTWTSAGLWTPPTSVSTRPGRRKWCMGLGQRIQSPCSIALVDALITQRPSFRTPRWESLYFVLHWSVSTLAGASEVPTLFRSRQWLLDREPTASVCPLGVRCMAQWFLWSLSEEFRYLFGAAESDTAGIVMSCLDFFQFPSCRKAASLFSNDSTAFT